MTDHARGVRASARALVAVLFAALFFFGLQAPMAQAVGGVDLTVTVTTKAGTALPGLEVIAYEVDNHRSDFSQFVEGETVSGSPAGRYLLEDLELNQDYALYFYVNNNPSSFDQFYGGTTWVEEARLLNWSSAGAETLSVSLATNTIITGKVSISSSKVLSGVRVTAYRFDGAGWYGVADALTSSSGLYTLRNLEPGSYRLGFEPNNLSGYAPRFSGGATSLQSAASFYSGLGSTTTSNMTLALGAKISGTVGLFPFDFNSAGVVPVAYRLLGDAINGYHGIDKGEFYVGPAVASGCTGMVVHCKWTVPGLPTGGYVVKLYDFSGLLPYYEPMWVDANDGTDKAALASPFTVTAPASVTDPVSTVLFTEGDIALTSLDITVKNPSNVPVEDALVTLSSDDNNDFQLSVETDALGVASFDRIGEGDFVAEITTDDAATQYHPDVRFITIAGTGHHTRTFTLAPVTGFALTGPADVTWANTNVGTQYDLVVPPTTMDDGSGVDQDVDYYFQWYRGATAIFGATDDSYITKSGDVGSIVSVVVTASTFGFADLVQVATAGVATAPGAAAVNSGLPAITSPSAAKPGIVLSAVAGDWDLSGLRFGYQWMRDGAPIPLATSRTYTLTPADASHDITVEVIAKKPGRHDSLPAVSADVAVGQLPAPVLKKNSVVTSTTKGLLAGQTKYTISMGTWSVPGATWHVNWYVDGVQEVGPTSGANSQTFLFKSADYLGNPVAPAVQAVVVVDKLGYTTAAKSYLVRRGGVPTETLAGGVTPPWSTTPYTDLDNVSWGDPLIATPPQLSYPTAVGNTVVSSYLWQRKIGTTWTTIPKATAATYVSTASDIGRLLRVRVTTTSSMYGTHTAYLSGGKTMGKWDIVGGLQPLIAINGTSDVTATKSALVIGTWPIAGVTQSYQWYTCDPVLPGADCDNPLDNNWTAVAKATAASWTPPATLLDKRIAVAVKASKSGYESLTLSSDGLTRLTALDEVSYLTGPKISAGLVTGNAVVGRTLTATAGSVDVAGATRVYTWEFSDDSGATWQPIPGAAHALTYLPPAAFQATYPGALIRFTETVSKAGLPGTDFAASSIYPLIPATNVPTKAPTVSGNATTGYIVNPGTWPAGTSIVVDWRENGGSILPPTVGPHVYQPTIPGSAVTATVVTTRPGYTAAPIRIVVRKGTATFAAAPLNGSTVGDTFSATSLGFTFPTATPEATYSYQWYSNNVAIKNLKTPTFVPSSGYLNKNVSLRVTMTSPLYNTLGGTHTATLVAVHPAAFGSPNLTSSTAAKPGVKLTVVPGVYSTTGLAFTYAIQRSTNGGTSWTTVTSSSSYTLTTTDAGTLFRATVTAKKAGWVNSVELTGNVAVGWLGPLATVGPLTLNGGAVGSALTVAPVWNATTVTATYRWERNGVTIPGVTGTSYTPLASNFGDEVQVFVTASKAGYQTAAFASNLVQVGYAVPPVATVVPVITGATGGTNKPKVGNVLSATAGVWNVDGLTFTYQWRAAGVDIPGATERTFTVTNAEETKIITVVVTAEKNGWANGTSISKPTLATIP